MQMMEFQHSGIFYTAAYASPVLLIVFTVAMRLVRSAFFVFQ